ncbi:hypothetical protein U1Q18_028602 [Sarracenia purpurea var. burkii]
MDSKSDSDLAILSPKRAVYYVQSPSRDSQDGDKSQQSTPAYTSPMESPSHSSTLASSASRFSGTLRSSKLNRKRNEKGWPECNVIEEEGDYGDLYGERRCRFLIGLWVFVSLFTLFCLIIWGASRPYRPLVVVKSLTVNNFYFGQGLDYTGVPTKFLTVNCSMKMIIYNPATFFGIHVSSTPIDLFYSEIRVATGQLKKYYQPRKSERIVSVNLDGNEVPLYGAGASLAVSDGVPLRLEFYIRSQGNIVGKLVKTKHQRHISCTLVVVDTSNTKAIKFKEGSCTYD